MSSFYWTKTVPLIFQQAQNPLTSRPVLERSTVSVWLLSGVLCSYNVSLHCHRFLTDPTVHHVTALLSFSPLSFYLAASLRDSQGSHFLSLVNRCLALRWRHVIGCLTRLTLAVHILPHGTIKRQNRFQTSPQIHWLEQLYSQDLETFLTLTVFKSTVVKWSRSFCKVNAGGEGRGGGRGGGWKNKRQKKNLRWGCGVT